MSKSRPQKSREELIAALIVAMREASGQGVLYSEAMAERLGINSTDLECLDVVTLRGPVTAGALVEFTGLTGGAITSVIDRLERAGLVERRSDRDDRRKVLVAALPSVSKDIAPLGEPMQRAVMAVLASYRDEELALLLEFLTRAGEASLAAMNELRRLPLPRRPKSAPRRGRPSRRS